MGSVLTGDSRFDNCFLRIQVTPGKGGREGGREGGSVSGREEVGREGGRGKGGRDGVR